MKHLYQDDICSIFFGDASTALIPEDFRGKKFKQLFSHKLRSDIPDMLSIKNAFFLQQVHGIKGKVLIKSEGQAPLFTDRGDFIITNLRSIGIGVATADCLPIIMIDKKLNIVSTIHAGWRGLVNGIVQHVLDIFETVYRSKKEDLKIFVGPSAGVCCYEVGFDFLKRPNIKKLPSEVFCEKSDRLFFDMKHFLNIICTRHGLQENQIETSYAKCTMCAEWYWSYRKNKQAQIRQITIVALK